MFSARIFAKYEIFNQAAEEYEEALKLAPNSLSVLDATISAHHRTGNFPREEELVKREKKIREGEGQ